MAGNETADRGLPRAMPWTLLDFGADLMVVVPAFSSVAPASAEIRVLARAPAVRTGEASRLALRVSYPDGAVRSFPLDAVSEESQAAVRQAPAGSVVVVEEDASAPGGRRHAYVAAIRAEGGPS